MSLNSEIERTLVIFKPEALEKRIIGTLMNYWDGHGFDLVSCKIHHGTKEEFKEHYSDLIGRYPEEVINLICTRLSRGPSMFLVYQGEDVISITRRIIGATDPKKARKNTIRAKFATSIKYNVVHASDSKENAERELKVWGFI